MEDYKENFKLYTESLMNKSTLLKLMNTGNYESIKDIRGLISQCKWNDKNIIIDVYNFNTGELFQNKKLFSSDILLKTEIIIIDIFKCNNFYDIICEGNINNDLLKYGTSLYIKSEDKNIKIGNIINIDKQTIKINPDLNDYELNFVKNKKLIFNAEIHSIQNFNKGICIYLPIIRIKDNKWALDCIVDKKTYENDNKFCFNLLDDINAANACGIISIGLIGAFIGKITYDTFQDKKKDYNVQDRINLLQILKKIKENKSTSESSSDSVSEMDSETDKSSDSEKSSESEVDLELEEIKNGKKSGELNNDSKKISEDINTNKNYLNDIREEIMNSNMETPDKILTNIQEIENTLQNNIEKDLELFEKEFEKINSNNFVNFEEQFLNISNEKSIDDIKTNTEDKNLNEAQYYINLLNNF